MQLDFLSKLTAWVRPRVASTPGLPAAEDSAPGLLAGSEATVAEAPETASPLAREPAQIQSSSELHGPSPAVDSLDAVSLQAHARALLCALGCDALATRVQVRWNPQMRSTAGTAQPSTGLISLNPRLRTFGKAEVDRTLRHELAHLLAHFRSGRRRIAPHGAEWRQACRDLGLPDEQRCHTLPLPRRTQRKKHAYRCPSCAVVIRRVQPLRKKAACLACCRRHNRGHYDERFRFVKVLMA